MFQGQHGTISPPIEKPPPAASADHSLVQSDDYGHAALALPYGAIVVQSGGWLPSLILLGSTSIAVSACAKDKQHTKDALLVLWAGVITTILILSWRILTSMDNLSLFVPAQIFTTVSASDTAFCR